MRLLKFGQGIDRGLQNKKPVRVDRLGCGEPVTQQMRVTTMRKIHILATAAALLVAASAPSLAASRTHRALDAYASGAVTTDRSGAYYYGPRDAQGRAGDNVAKSRNGPSCSPSTTAVRTCRMRIARTATRTAGKPSRTKTPAAMPGFCACRVSSCALYALTCSMNFCGGGSPHCETSASSADSRFEPFLMLSRSLSAQCSCTRRHGSAQ